MKGTDRGVTEHTSNPYGTRTQRKQIKIDENNRKKQAWKSNKEQARTQRTQNSHYSANNVSIYVRGREHLNAFFN